MRIDEPKIEKELNLKSTSSAGVTNNSIFLDSSDNIVKVKDNAGNSYDMLDGQVMIYDGPVTTGQTILFNRADLLKLKLDAEGVVTIQINNITTGYNSSARRLQSIAISTDTLSVAEQSIGAASNIAGRCDIAIVNAKVNLNSSVGISNTDMRLHISRVGSSVTSLNSIKIVTSTLGFLRIIGYKL